jgi:hypothetical protein
MLAGKTFKRLTAMERVGLAPAKKIFQNNNNWVKRINAWIQSLAMARRNVPGCNKHTVKIGESSKTGKKAKKKE